MIVPPPPLPPHRRDQARYRTLHEGAGSLRLAVLFAAGVLLGLTLGSPGSGSSSGPGAGREPLPGASPGSDVAQSSRAPLAEVAGAEPAVGSGGAPSRRAVPPVRLPAAASQQPSAPAVSVRETSASWYCNADPARGPLSRCTTGHPDTPGPDLYAAVSPDLPRGMLRVCAASCVTVEAIDCRCSSPGIDLYADAFEALAPLSVGLVKVTASPQPFRGRPCRSVCVHASTSAQRQTGPAASVTTGSGNSG